MFSIHIVLFVVMDLRGVSFEVCAIKNNSIINGENTQDGMCS